MFKRIRHGFTLVELLVVIAIIGMLVSILLPAVQGARNAGRRTQNSNNLKNIGLAVLGHVEAKGNLPPLRLIRPTGTSIPKYMQKYPDREHSVSWAFELLPFMEQGNLFDQLRRDLPTVHIDQKVTQQTLSVFQNPGRGERFFAENNSDFPATLIDYAANRGLIDFQPSNRNDQTQYETGFRTKPEYAQYVGPFVHNEIISTAHVKDGLSKTIAIADKWVPLDTNSGKYVDLNGLAGESDFALMRGPSASVNRDPQGRITGYDLLGPPLFPASEQDLAMNKFGGATGGNMLAVCYLDGHVSWVEYGIDPAAFIAQSTMNGSDGLLDTE